MSNDQDHACRSAPDSTDALCPVSGSKGRPVGRITPASLLRDPGRLGTGPFFFCPDRDCEVVYFTGCGDRDRQEIYTKPDLAVRVGQKETEDPIPVCYCFDFTVAMLREEIDQTGATTIPDRIAAEIKAGNCSCETRNPQGSCCLGNVNAAVRSILARTEPES